jgi:hypothetical protein
MELYVNSNWTACYANACIAEAIAWSENGNHASIYSLAIRALAPKSGRIPRLSGEPRTCAGSPSCSRTRVPDTGQSVSWRAKRLRGVCSKLARLSQRVYRLRYQHRYCH